MNTGRRGQTDPGWMTDERCVDRARDGQTDARSSARTSRVMGGRPDESLGCSKAEAAFIPSLSFSLLIGGNGEVVGGRGWAGARGRTGPSPFPSHFPALRATSLL